MQIESREAVREAVAAGLGIGVVSEAEFDRDKRLSALRVRDARLEITEHVVCLQERRRLRIVRAFLESVDHVAPAGRVKV
jgi:DNA-binding transcriptional LysR family regulator